MVYLEIPPLFSTPFPPYSRGRPRNERTFSSPGRRGIPELNYHSFEFGFAFIAERSASMNGDRAIPEKFPNIDENREPGWSSETYNAMILIASQSDDYYAVEIKSILSAYLNRIFGKNCKINNLFSINNIYINQK